jgi:hypothetical protein
MRVPVGMLGDDDRRLLIISKSEGLPVVIASLSAYVWPDGAVGARLVEPWTAQGVVAQWSSDYITLALDSDTVFIPWVSAVQVWRPDEAPPLNERMSIIRMYATGSRPASELPPNIRP